MEGERVAGQPWKGMAALQLNNSLISGMCCNCACFCKAWKGDPEGWGNSPRLEVPIDRLLQRMPFPLLVLRTISSLHAHRVRKDAAQPMEGR